MSPGRASTVPRGYPPTTLHAMNCLTASGPHAQAPLHVFPRGSHLPPSGLFLPGHQSVPWNLLFLSVGHSPPTQVGGWVHGSQPPHVVPVLQCLQGYLWLGAALRPARREAEHKLLPSAYLAPKDPPVGLAGAGGAKRPGHRGSGLAGCAVSRGGGRRVARTQGLWTNWLCSEHVRPGPAWA